MIVGQRRIKNGRGETQGHGHKNRSSGGTGEFSAQSGSNDGCGFDDRPKRTRSSQRSKDEGQPQLRGPEELGENEKTLLHAEDARDRTPDGVRETVQHGLHVHQVRARGPERRVARTGRGRAALVGHTGRDQRLSRRNQTRGQRLHQIRNAVQGVQVAEQECETAKPFFGYNRRIQRRRRARCRRP